MSKISEKRTAEGGSSERAGCEADRTVESRARKDTGNAKGVRRMTKRRVSPKEKTDTQTGVCFCMTKILEKRTLLATHKISCPYRAKFWLRRSRADKTVHRTVLLNRSRRRSRPKCAIAIRDGEVSSEEIFRYCPGRRRCKRFYIATHLAVFCSFFALHLLFREKFTSNTFHE